MRKLLKKNYKAIGEYGNVLKTLMYHTVIPNMLCLNNVTYGKKLNVK